MGYVFGSSPDTKFSWIEYQVLMLCLAALLFAAILLVELAVRKFQVLPLTFPGMFTVRERRFFFFHFDISDGHAGKKIRGEAKMIMRITACCVLSYLWQHCVLETMQKVGTEFPSEQCREGHDCFASEFEFLTLLNRNQMGIDCKKPQDFDHRVTISCIRLIRPSGPTWLMHMAVAYSVSQLSFKAFELLVWIGGGSRWLRRILSVSIFIWVVVFILLCLGGLFATYESSWLSFVVSLTLPMFFHSVWKASKSLERLWVQDAVKVQDNIEVHLSGAFTEIAGAIDPENKRGFHDRAGIQAQDSSFASVQHARGVFNHIRNAFTWRLKRRPSGNSLDGDACRKGDAPASGIAPADSADGSWASTYPPDRKSVV